MCTNNDNTLHLFSQKNKPLKTRREVHYLFPEMRSISHFALTSLAQALLRDIMSTEGLLLTTLLIYASQPASSVQSIRALLEDYLLFTCSWLLLGLSRSGSLLLLSSSLLLPLAIVTIVLLCQYYSDYCAFFG